MNRDNIINYYNGTRAYNMFLLGTMYNEPTYLEYIKDKTFNGKDDFTLAEECVLP